MQNNLVKLILSKPEYPENIKKDLAKISGLSIETINRYCRNKNSAIDARVAILFAKYFNCDVQELYIKDHQSKKPKPRRLKKTKRLYQK
jgi:transcriptional regulator with XRE-family HTH domain